MESKKNTKKRTLSIRKIAMAGVLVAVAVAGSLISFPVAGSKCAPVQHMVNICAAVFLGPAWGVGVAFCASIIRNLTGLGSLMAFPGSMVGALCCGLMYRFSKKIIPTCIAEALGTGILGGLAAYPLAKYVMLIQPEGMFIYIVPFLISTVAGSRMFSLLSLTKTPIRRHCSGRYSGRCDTWRTDWGKKMNPIQSAPACSMARMFSGSRIPHTLIIIVVAS